jgi:imidazolonepropionase-like amidohydrolase
MRERQPEEFRLRADVQSSAAVLRSATTVAASLLGREGRLGTITPGAYGDVVLIHHDPLTNIARLADPAQEIALVVQSGTIVA